jgi:signal transduction histidine kinase
VLVVDDQEETLVSVRTLLEREGHRILTAESGEQALDILRTNDVHVIVVDHCMPRMNGAQLVREVRRFDPYVQIILQTGYAGEQPPREMLAELDIQGYHDKTDDPQRLLLWVDVALKTHRLLLTLRRREQLQGEMVANCSHEFRTPLHIVVGYAGLLRDGHFGAIPAAAAQALKSIEDAARGLSELVSDFLQYAKLDADVVAPTGAWADLHELGEEIQRFASLLLEDREIDFALEVDAAPPRFFTDATKLRAIVRNLVANAAKFTTRGRVTLRIVARAGALRVEVQDTGPGIRAEDRERIFEPFRQLDGSSTRSHGGVGLGLALARKLARTLGGDIAVESEPGAGSTFALVLPAAAAAGGALAPEPALASHP